MGTATTELSDLDGCDCVFVIGANPASNHPQFIHKLQACRARGGPVIIINPVKEPGLVRFVLPKSPKSLIIGGDEIASHYVQPRIGSDIALLEGIAKDTIERKRVGNEFIYSHTEGYAEFLSDIKSTRWSNIEKIKDLSGDVCKPIGTVHNNSENTVFAWGMGATHHKHGVENVEYISSMALLRGMIAKRFSGLLPLRGHCNV